MTDVLQNQKLVELFRQPAVQAGLDQLLADALDRLGETLHVQPQSLTGAAAEVVVIRNLRKVIEGAVGNAEYNLMQGNQDG